MQKLLFLFLCLFTTLNGLAQKVTLSGYVSDAKTGERLIAATVYLPALQIGTRTNNYGFFSITLDKQSEPRELVVSYLGYSNSKDTLMLDQSMSRDIRLKSTKELKEVVVKSSRTEKIHESTQMSAMSIPIETIKKLPAFMGEVDILKSLQLLPGIQAGGEGQNGLYVRGGGPDQNLILLDGVPVYNASHLFGFFSVFNADAVSSVEVYKGGFPARYGGRLSSVIDIRMKEGTKSGGIHGNVGIGLISSRLMLEGPFGKKNKKGSWMISGRRTYIDLITTPIIKAASDGQGTGGYYFWDVNAKANYKLGPRDHIYLSAYTGKDKFYAKGFENKKETFRADINWGNLTALLRWNHEFNNKLFGNLSATYTRYQFEVFSKLSSNFGGTTSSFSALYKSGIYDVALKYDLDFIPSPRHYIKAGISGTYHQFKPGAVTLKNSDLPEANIDTAFNVSKVPEFDIYVEDDIELSKKLKANIGVHASAFVTASQFYPSIQPRVSARYLLHPEWSIKASFSTMAQFIHLLTNNGIGLPTDLWVPVTDKIKPMQSLQGAVGIAHTWRDQYEFSLEGYYKQMKNIIEYKDGSSFLNTNQSWEDKVEMGKGWSYGAEAFIQKKTGRLTGLMGYTLSWTNRQFPTINFGKTFPYKYDRRHDFKIAAVYKLSKRVEVSGDWVYGTGNAISMPLYKYPAAPINDMYQGFWGGNTIYHYGERNNFRMNAYHRLDLGVNFVKTTKRGYERTWNISVYNAYSRKNPYFIYPTTDDQGNDIFKQVSLFPVLPSFSYNLKF